MTEEKRKTGGSNDYYSAEVSSTLDGRPGYVVQCLEVIETLGMTFAEGEAFKAIWRSCAARTLGKHKADNNALYDAEKVEFYGKRMVVAAGDRGARAEKPWGVGTRLRRTRATSAYYVKGQEYEILAIDPDGMLVLSDETSGGHRWCLERAKKEFSRA